MTETITQTSDALAEDVAKFHEQGFLGPIKVYEEDEMRKLWRRERLRLVDRRAAVYNDDAAKAGNTNIANYDRHLDSTFLADHICHPVLLDYVTAVLGQDVLCWRSEFFPKYPGDEGTDWHQADTFAFASGKPQILWPDERKEWGGTLTVWCAFTPATLETACLQFIPGTHGYWKMNYDENKELVYQPEKINASTKEGTFRGFYGYDYRQLQKDPDWRPPEEKSVPMVLRPGEAVMFWSTLMHASKPHSALDQEMRLGFAGRYVPNCVSIYPDTEDVDEYGGVISLKEWGAVQVAGTDTYGQNRIRSATTGGHPFPTRRPG